MEHNVNYQLEMLVMEAEQLGSLQAAIVDAVDYSPSASKEYLGALQQMEKLLRKHSTDLRMVLELIEK